MTRIEGPKETWQDQEGRIHRLCDMDTKHLFNCAKLLYNHIAEAWGLPTIWYRHKYGDFRRKARRNPQELGGKLVEMLSELETRTIPAKYREPYLFMWQQIAKALKLSTRRLTS